MCSRVVSERQSLCSFTRPTAKTSLARIVSSESPEKASGVVELEPGLQLDFNNAFDVRNVQCPSHTTESALIRRIDLKVMPVLVIVYLLAFLDR